MEVEISFCCQLDNSWFLCFCLSLHRRLIWGERTKSELVTSSIVFQFCFCPKQRQGFPPSKAQLAIFYTHSFCSKVTSLVCYLHWKWNRRKHQQLKKNPKFLEIQAWFSSELPIVILSLTSQSSTHYFKRKWKKIDFKFNFNENLDCHNLQRIAKVEGFFSIHELSFCKTAFSADYINV